ncbi:M13-type metalloendopeptidase [Chitinimonas sp. BJB300]|uniref:M13-type metalloendopeptidase n=1 Tax=Chitinimonas sp. BJB300 TaxID=1559339 RepID=UPI000C0F94E2|nr:M13-type metalloendopeptidase [Chitinimonas sp. BJB300]PHV10616.1 hypothetical protein CSQ89_15220 [Chitinimonas sp. BJB300]TSJ87699.1 M13 family metallopeptidase [Chitinimonas sp. BJB300]
MSFIGNKNALKGGSIIAAATAFLMTGCIEQRNEAACTDFDQMVNGDWLQSVQRAAGSDSPDAYADLPLRNQQALLTALEAAARAPLANENSDLGKLVRLFASQAQPAPTTITALSEELLQVDAIAQVQDVPMMMAKLLRVGTVLPIALQAKQVDFFESDDLDEPDTKPIQLELILGRGMLFGNTVEARRSHVARMLELTGVAPDQAVIHAEAVERMEKQLSESVPVTSQNLVAFDMVAFKQHLGFSLDTQVDVADTALEAKLSRMLSDFSVQEWQSFLKWRLAKSFSAYLPETFSVEEKRWLANWRPQFLAQNNQLRSSFPLDSRLRFLAELMPDALDRFYLEKVVGTAQLEGLGTLAQEIRTEMRARFETRTWISEAGREATLRWLDSMSILLARPEAWIDYSSLTVALDDTLGNIKRAKQLNFDGLVRSASTLPRLGARGGFGWSSYGPGYIQGRNAVVADIAMLLTQPEINFESNKAFTYGVLGTLLAHEMTHAFDTSGAQTLLPGMPSPPPLGFSGADIAYFKSMEDRQYRHYAEYVKKSLGVDVLANRITGEDVADLTGLEVTAQLVNKKWPEANAMEQFFKGYAFSHRDGRNQTEIREMAVEVPAHAISKYRVNGMLGNLPAFAVKYGCVAGDAMVRAEKDRITLW